MAMEIRQFVESDRHAVIELWAACDLTRPWNDPNRDIDRKLQFQPELFLVGTAGARVVASAMAGYDGHRGSVFYLGVYPEFQGLGYGRQFMVHLEDALAAMGCPKLNIAVRSSNEPVLSFYRDLSYTEDDVVSIGKRLIEDEH